MKSKVAGTFYVDGLLQGRAPVDDTFNASIESWIQAAKANGLDFSFSRDGSNFTLLPGDEIRKTSAFGPIRVQDALRDAFQQFLEFFPVQERMHLLSTLRSVEYRPNAEVQTIYAVVPPGKIENQERTIDANTVDPDPELTKAGKIKIALIAVGAVAVMGLLFFFLAKTFFPEWLEDKQDQLAITDAKDISIDDKILSDYLTIEKMAINRKKKGLEVKLIRGPQWQSAIDSQKPVDVSWEEFLAIQSIKRGYIRLELYDRKDKLIAFQDLNISALKKRDKAPALIYLPAKKVHRIKLIY